jgi:hypothetical protein
MKEGENREKKRNRRKKKKGEPNKTAGRDGG